MAQAELLKTFNAGIGMVAVVPEARAQEAARILTDAGATVTRIGRVSEGAGISYTGALL